MNAQFILFNYALNNDLNEMTKWISVCPVYSFCEENQFKWHDSYLKCYCSIVDDLKDRQKKYWE